MNKTIAIDFDWVIHKYSKWWSDGSIYDEPIKWAMEAIKTFMDMWYSVFIFSTRDPKQIKKWIYYMYWRECYSWDDPMNWMDFSYLDLPFEVKVISFWNNWFSKFWNKSHSLGITSKKLVADVYIDDRAFRFEWDWKKTLKSLKPYLK